MFTDAPRAQVRDALEQRGVRAFTRFLRPTVFAEAAHKAGCRIVSCPLNLVNLVWLGLAASLDTTQSFAAVLTVTLRILADAPCSPSQTHVPLASHRASRRAAASRSKHDPRRNDPTTVTEEAFVQARHRMPLGFWLALTSLLADRFVRQHAVRIRWKTFRLLALDGTLINLPRWRALADHYGTAKGSRGGRVPQARLLMLQFPLARVPYRYALGTRRQAEKTMAEPLLTMLLPDDLVLMDRGFWSYGLFSRVAQQKAYFAIREIAQAHLTPVRTLGPNDTLVRYAPTDPMWRRRGLPAAMDLRRIAYQVRGFRPSAILTNLTDPQVISRAEWVGMTTTHKAGRVLDRSIYHHRWEIETSFSELKVFQKMTAFRGRTAGTIDYEIASHVLLYLLVRWLLVEAATAQETDPLRLSFTGALREIRGMGWALAISSPTRARRVLLPRLLARLAAHSVPDRPGRHYPRPHDTKTKDVGYGQTKKPSKLAS
jgi:hypothetical protein